jgi:acyl-CoA synthetase (NDP forming)
MIRKAEIDRSIFYPRSVAVIGASGDPLKFGGIYLRALLDFGFKGKIFPVNPRGGELMGIHVFRSLDEVPEKIDLACISLPAEKVAESLRDCLGKGVKGAQILTAGFREAGEDGRRKEQELVEISRQGIRIIGPNCFGIYSPEAGLTLMPGAQLSREPGTVGFFSQSGGGSCDAGYMAQGRGVKFSVMVSYGNGCDIEAAELLDYFREDTETELVAAYLEGVRDAREFFRALNACASEKPVVIYKGGLTGEGERGTMSHTGSLAGNRDAWNAAISQAGAIPAYGLKDLVECCMALVTLKEFTGRGFGIMAGGGARNVEALDAADTHGFRVPALPESTARKISQVLPLVGGAPNNPVDLANPMLSPEVISRIMEALAEEPEIDGLMLYQVLFYLMKEGLRFKGKEQEGSGLRFEYHTALAEAARKIRHQTGKPLIIIMPDVSSEPEYIEAEKGRWDARKYYCEKGVPVFDHPEAAFSVLRRTMRYWRNRKAGKRI